MSSLLAAMSHASRPLAVLVCLVSLWAGPGTALAATWQAHREAGLHAFANADYAASAEHLERALAAADGSQASARERGVIYERLTTAYLATRWFRRARNAISRWDRVLEESPGEPWAFEQRGVRDSLVVLVNEVIGDPAPEAASEAAPSPQPPSAAAGETPARAGEGSAYEAVVDVPFAPDAPLPVNLAADRSFEAAVAPSSVPPTAPAAGGFVLHLVSLTDQEAVEGSWAKLQDAYPELLAGKELAVRQVDLGDRGIFYRLHAAPYGVPEIAQATCEKLRSLDQYCAVVDLE